jgi:20S proteasome subunit alpha 7
MSSIGTGYDLSPTTYSPDGRVYQVEYAQKAVSNSGTVVGICCSDGVVLGVENMVEFRMLEHDSLKRIYHVDRHIGFALCGWKPDCRQLVHKARQEAHNYYEFYGSRITGQLLCDRISSVVHMYTCYWHLRPFGSSILIASHDLQKGPELFMIDPSGTSWGYHAVAVGKGRQAAKTELEKLNPKELKCIDAVEHIARIINGVHDKAKEKDFFMEMSWVCEASHRQHEMVPQHLVDAAMKKVEKEKQQKKDKEEGDVDLGSKMVE